LIIEVLAFIHFIAYRIFTEAIHAFQSKVHFQFNPQPNSPPLFLKDVYDSLPYLFFLQPLTFNFKNIFASILSFAPDLDTDESMTKLH